MDSAISKTTYELLSVSDSDSDAPPQMQDLHFKSPRRKRLRKRLPSNRLRRYDQVPNQTCCYSYGRLLSLSFIIIVLCCWLLILSWLVVIFNDELRRFDSNIMAIVAGNQGIPESVRQCHSQTKELQKNQSQMSVRIDSLNTQLNNLSKEISQISNELKSIQHKLTVSPASSNVPTDLKELSENVGNWISELNDTVAQLKQSENHLKDGFQALRLNVTSLKEKLSLLDQVPKYSVVANNEASRSDFQQLIFNLTSSVTYLNTTLSDEINLIKRNYSHDHLLIENLQSFLSQNITLRLSALQDEYKAEHLLFASLSDTVKNLTNQFNSTRSKMNKLADEMNVLRGFQADEKNRKLDEVSTTLLPVAN